MLFRDITVLMEDFTIGTHKYVAVKDDRIAYIDVDAHHGDGVQAAFLADPRVMTVSVHQHPATLWPNTGWSTEVGADAAEGTSVNVPVLPGTGDRLWLRASKIYTIAALPPSVGKTWVSSASLSP